MNAHRDDGTLLPLLVALLLGAAFIMWALAQPTAGDMTRLADSLGPDPTGTVWARPLPDRPAFGTADQHAPVATIQQPSTSELLAGRACLSLQYLMAGRAPAVEHSFGRDVSCAQKDNG